MHLLAGEGLINKVHLHFKHYFVNYVHFLQVSIYSSFLLLIKSPNVAAG